MDKFDRVYELHRILSGRRTPISCYDLSLRLECTQATVKRIIRVHRESLDAPVVYDRERQGYFYENSSGEPYFELPGLWFNEAELFALVTFMQLLQNLEPRLLSEYLAPFQGRLEKLLKHRRLGLEGIAQKIRILGKAQRQVGQYFATVATATLRSRRLSIHYVSRYNNHHSEREVSPLRLVHYRNAWYLDAWCHLREQLRSFSVDRITQAKVLETTAQTVDLAEADTYFGSAYGIYSGLADKTAELIFTPQQAGWVEAEEWHPAQQCEYLPDGRYRMLIPFHNATELSMDILKYGAGVEVVAPESLRLAVMAQHEKAWRQYQKEI